MIEQPFDVVQRLKCISALLAHSIHKQDPNDSRRMQRIVMQGRSEFMLFQRTLCSITLQTNRSLICWPPLWLEIIWNLWSIFVKFAQFRTQTPLAHVKFHHPSISSRWLAKDWSGVCGKKVPGSEVKNGELNVEVVSNRKSSNLKSERWVHKWSPKTPDVKGIDL